MSLAEIEVMEQALDKICGVDFFTKEDVVKEFQDKPTARLLDVIWKDTQFAREALKTVKSIRVNRLRFEWETIKSGLHKDCTELPRDKDELAVIDTMMTNMFTQIDPVGQRMFNEHKTGQELPPNFV